MTGTLRHDASIPREEDGAVNFDDLINKNRKNREKLCSGQTTLGRILWQKEEKRKRDFKTA